MTRRAVVLCGLFVVASQLSSGCCHWRPFLFRGCWPHCYSPAGASGPATMPVSAPIADPGCACYQAPYTAVGAVGQAGPVGPQGQPVFIGPAVPLGQPQISPGGSIPNPMAPAPGTPKN